MDNQTPEKPKLRGLYRNVNISVKVLDLVILACVAVIVLAVFFGQGSGYTVTFDSRGGSDVAPVTAQYGELLDMPQPPQREGYVFTGWYRDSACMEPWDFAADTLQADMTLYAGWNPAQDEG